MEKVRCPECNADISNDANVCTNCGFELDNQRKKVNKKIHYLIITCTIIIIAIFCSIKIFSQPHGLEKEAKHCLKELEGIVGEVELKDAVCITKMYYGDEEVTYCYLLWYAKDGVQDVAFFNSVGYVGNGYNGGNDVDETQVPFNNIQSLNAQRRYMEYLLDGSHLITEEQAQDNEEGLIPLDVEKIK